MEAHGSIARSRKARGGWYALLVAVGLTSGCASAPQSRSVQLTPPPVDVEATLIQFHGAVSAQMAAGGMELEHYLAVTQWIGDGLRVLHTKPQQWEGQARLDWPRIRSIVVPFENLQAWGVRIDRLVQ